MQSIKSIVKEIRILEKLKKDKLWLFILIVFALFTYYIRQAHIKKDVLEYHHKTFGEIYNYYVVGAEAANYLDYKYFVGNNLYSRRINVASRKYEKCKDDIELCKGKKFWVIYSPNNPKNSLIDLSIEIQGMENPPFPGTLDNFE